MKFIGVSLSLSLSLTSFTSRHCNCLLTFIFQLYCCINTLQLIKYTHLSLLGKSSTLPSPVKITFLPMQGVTFYQAVISIMYCTLLRAFGIHCTCYIACRSKCNKRCVCLCVCMCVCACVCVCVFLRVCVKSGGLYVLHGYHREPCESTSITHRGESQIRELFTVGRKQHTVVERGRGKLIFSPFKRKSVFKFSHFLLAHFVTKSFAPKICRLNIPNFLGTKKNCLRQNVSKCILLSYLSIVCFF